MFYSKSTNGFYDPTINISIPTDAVEISNNVYLNLLETQQTGKIIQPDNNGYPHAVDIALTEQQLLNSCVSKAKELLSATDWSVLPDVALKNNADFVNYRKILRGLIINPVSNPNFPSLPTPVWQ